MIFVKCEGVDGSTIDAIRQARNLAEVLNRVVSDMTNMQTKQYGVILTVQGKEFYVFRDTDAEVLYYMHKAHA